MTTALDPDARPRRPPVLALALKVVLSGAMLAFLLTRVPLRQVWSVLRAAHPTDLTLAAVLLLASNVLGAYQWDRLLRAARIRIPFAKVLAYYHVGLFFNNFLPANIGGDIARVMDSARYGETRAAALSAVVLDRLIGTVALAGLAVVTTLPAIDRFHLGVVYGALVAFFAVGVAALWAVLHPRSIPGLARWCERVGLARARPHLEELARHFAGARERRPMMVGLLAIAVVVQVARVGVHVLCARSLGLDVPMTYFFLFVPLLAVIVSLPISLNGIGVREGAGIVLFGWVGVDRTHAFSLQFATYLVAVAVSLLGALVLLARIPVRAMRARELRRTT
jgi:uncharacterized protein (TIRG00374 family)